MSNNYDLSAALTGYFVTRQRIMDGLARRDLNYAIDMEICKADAIISAAITNATAVLFGLGAAAERGLDNGTYGAQLAFAEIRRAGTVEELNDSMDIILAKLGIDTEPAWIEIIEELRKGRTPSAIEGHQAKTPWWLLPVLESAYARSVQLVCETPPEEFESDREYHLCRLENATTSEELTRYVRDALATTNMPQKTKERDWFTVLDELRNYERPEWLPQYMQRAMDKWDELVKQEDAARA